MKIVVLDFVAVNSRVIKRVKYGEYCDVVELTGETWVPRKLLLCSAGHVFHMYYQRQPCANRNWLGIIWLRITNNTGHKKEETIS